MSSIAAPKHSAFRRLTITRFRGVLDLTWTPSPGVNFILGGGDAGKTTILEAVGLLLNPNPNASIADTDYWERDVAKGFVVEGVISLAETVAISHQQKINWPWVWNGKDLANVPDDSGSTWEKVYVIRVRGNEDLELVYEVVQPDESVNQLSSSIRRAIGLMRLTNDERNDRDLRLVQGSALDRVLDDHGFRARAARDLADEPVGNLLDGEAKKALGTLDDSFRKKDLPNPISLGIIGAAGFSLNALIGLKAPRGKTILPLTSWGGGTRRLASLTTAAALHENSPIGIIDEVERGLESYRQHSLVQSLASSTSQLFVTTHSPLAMRAASGCTCWYLDSSGRIGLLTGEAIERKLQRDPETFLARFTVVAEGATEVGFVLELLRRQLPLPLADYGLHVTDAGSNEEACEILTQLGRAGLSFAGMADNEGTKEGSWADLAKFLGPRLCRWEKGCLEEVLLEMVPDDQFEAFLSDPEDEKTGMRLRTLADRLGLQQKDFATIHATAGAGLRKLIAEACCGTVPDAHKAAEKKTKREFQAHARSWFKSLSGGRELAGKVIVMGLWPKLADRLLPFLNSIREGVGVEKSKGF